MDKVIIWVNENKEWFFSGIGVTIVLLDIMKKWQRLFLIMIERRSDTE